jgi:hypothetical protein
MKPFLRFIQAHRHIAALSVAGAALLAATQAASPTPTSASTHITVLASHLNQPKKLTLTSRGALLVALSGDGVAPASCTDGDQASCADRSGAVDEVSAAGRVTTLLTGLSSVSSGGSDAQATGPVQAISTGRRLQVLFQGSVISAGTGQEVYGAAGDQLERLISFSGAHGTVRANLGGYEAVHNPDQGAGTEIA